MILGGGSTEKTTEFQTWGRNDLRKNRVQELKKTCDFEGGSTVKTTEFFGDSGESIFFGSEKNIVILGTQINL